VHHIKDLGITFDFKLNFSIHISEKANYILCIIKETVDNYLKKLSVCYIKH